MANEYLKRVATSSGNSSVFTWSAWIKKDFAVLNTNINIFTAGFPAGNTSGQQEFQCFFDSTLDKFKIYFGTSGVGIDGQVQTSRYFRDLSNWFNLIISVNTTSSDLYDRIKIYINGVQQTNLSITSYPSQNYKTTVNKVNSTLNVGGRTSTEQTWKGGIFDSFFVDGQALTPEVFGYNKDGRGYISAGSTQATDFRNGQWLPKKPKLIIDEINASGGFGVNGFYLPMNSSKNFGADFHTTPNTILKLKDNLPQPKAEIDGSGDYSGDIRDDLGGLPFPGVVKFDGTGDYLSLATSTDFSFGSEDFTIEGWFYPTNLSGVDKCLVEFRGSGSPLDGWIWFLNSSNQMRIYDNGLKTASTIAITTNNWFHLSIIRSNGILYYYVNGQNAGSFSYASSTNVSSTGVRIGTRNDITNSFTGFISNLRVIKGTALYTSNFTPPTQPLQKTTDTVLLCCNSKTDPTNEETGKTITKNGDVYATTSELTDALVLAIPFVSGGLQNGFGDYSAAIKGRGTSKTITNSNVSIANTASYYGSSASFSGGNRYLTATMGSDLSFGTADFTIEFWAYVLSNSSNAYIFDTNINGIVIGYGAPVGNPSANRWRYYNGSNASWTLYTSNPEPVLNQWTHIAVCRKNERTTFYVNGVATSTELDSTNYTNVNSSTINIGRYGGGGIVHDGYLQDFRIYKGIAKYKGGFDVPRPYTPTNFANWRAVPDTTANNFATLNPLTHLDNNNIAYTNGNLTAYVLPNTNSTVSTIAMSSIESKKYYAEFRATSNLYPRVGVIDATVAQQGVGVSGGGLSNAKNLNITGTISWGGVGNELFINGSAISAVGYIAGDIIGVAYDSATRNVWFSKNGVWQNFTGSGANPATGTNPVGAVNGSDSVYFAIRPENSNIDCNFGQNPTFSGNTTAGTFTDSNGKGLFKYEPPTGFLALCEDNLPTPAISDPGKHFKTVLWTGDSANGRSITGVGFKPDFVWIKNRANGVVNSWHSLSNSVTPGRLFSNQSNPEDSFKDVGSFDTDGMTINYGTYVNTSGGTYVAWCWKAGGPAVTNTDGTITSQVSANQDAGFSIVSWTANTSSPNTIGHGLSKTPKFIIAKRRNQVSDWIVYHSSLPATDYILLNSNNAKDTSSVVWNNTSPTSSVFTVGSIFDQNETVIAYCWAEIEGFSKFGSYVGNGSADGPFVYCGFKPAWVMIKNTSVTGYWNIWDSSRTSSNPCDKCLFPNVSDIEAVTAGGAVYDVDFLSNGFKIRTGSATHINGSGNTIIFVAFAESPFQYANSK